MPAFNQVSHIFHTSSFTYFALNFLECITIPSSKEALKASEHNFLVESSITCNLPVQLIMAFDVLLSSFLSN